MAKRRRLPSIAPDSQPAGVVVPSLDPALQRRIVIESVAPEVDGGRFPIKRTPGEAVTVEADVFADGHDIVAAVILWRVRGDDRWNEVAMVALGNDRWTARFEITELAAYEPPRARTCRASSSKARPSSGRRMAARAVRRAEHSWPMPRRCSRTVRLRAERV
jgi:hypothetical protein